MAGRRRPVSCTDPGNPTKIPQIRVPGCPHKNPTDETAFCGTHTKIGTKTSPEQAKRRGRWLSAVPINGGQGRHQLEHRLQLPGTARAQLGSAWVRAAAEHLPRHGDWGA